MFCRYCGKLSPASLRCVYCGESAGAKTRARISVAPVEVPVEETEPFRLILPAEKKKSVKTKKPAKIKKPRNPCAIVGLVLGCLGWTSLFGLLFSVYAFIKYKKNPKVGRRRTAIAGIVVSAIVFVYLVILLIIRREDVFSSMPYYY